MRHIIPVSELKVINDVTSRGSTDAPAIIDFANPDLPNPDDQKIEDPLVAKLEEINQTLKQLNQTLSKLIK